VLRGRSFVTPDDVRDMATPALRHRIVLKPEAEIEGTTADQCVKQVIERVEVPRL
jgi:MoxR-like ATPase